MQKLTQRYGIPAEGVLHVGANTGQERPQYQNMGMQRVIWVEANPPLAESLKAKISNEPAGFQDEQVIQAAVYDVEGKEIEFNISNKGGESSSILEFGAHATEYPDVKFIEKITMQTRRLDKLFDEQPALAKGINGLHLDIQGVEYEALIGLGDYLNQFHWILSEVNKDELYQRNHLLWDIDRLLLANGFVRKAINIKYLDWGDAFYLQIPNMSRTERALRSLRIHLGETYWKTTFPLRKAARHGRFLMRRFFNRIIKRGFHKLYLILKHRKFNFD